MNILAISDLHGNLEGLDFSGQDIVIIAGDFAQLKGRGKWHIYDQKKWIEKRFIPFVSKWPMTKFLIVPGNHDMCLDPKWTMPHTDVNWTIDWPDNCELLIDRGIVVNGLKVYGTPWVPIISYTWAFEGDHAQLVERFNRIPTDLDILITHSPPHISNVFVDWSLQTNYGPFGSGELTNAIFNRQPKHLFCGHIHSGDHETTAFENVQIHNVSRLDERYEIAYEPFSMTI